MALEDGLSAADAGALIKKRRKERGLTQEQLVDKTGLSSQSYLSALEKGRYHIGRSEHFGAVAQVLRLSEADIRAINPAAVITVAAPEAEPRHGNGSPIPPVVPFRNTTVSIPDELQRMADNNADRYPELQEPRILRMLAAPRQEGGADSMPQTEDEWLEYWLITRRWYR